MPAASREKADYQATHKQVQHHHKHSHMIQEAQKWEHKHTQHNNRNIQSQRNTKCWDIQTLHVI